MDNVVETDRVHRHGVDWEEGRGGEVNPDGDDDHRDEVIVELWLRQVQRDGGVETSGEIPEREESHTARHDQLTYWKMYKLSTHIRAYLK